MKIKNVKNGSEIKMKNLDHEWYGVTLKKITKHKDSRTVIVAVFDIEDRTYYTVDGDMEVEVVQRHSY